MKSSLQKVAALLPLPAVVGLMVWASGRPLPPPAKLKGSHGKGTAAFELPAKLGKTWLRNRKTKRFDPKSLFDRINGAAPVYLQAGYRFSLGSEYKHTRSERTARARDTNLKEPAQVDLYEMGTVPRAFGIFATERDRTAPEVKVGDGAYAAAGSLNFWRGSVYGKIAGYDEGKDITPQLVALAKGLVAFVEKGGMTKQGISPKTGRALVGRWKKHKESFNEEFALLPAGALPKTRGYAHGPLQRINGLQQFYYAEYALNAKEPTQGYRLALRQFASAVDAKKTLGKIEKALAAKDPKLAKRQQDGAELMTATYVGGKVMVLRKAARIGAVLGIDSEPVTKTALKKLQQALGAQ